MSVRTALIAPLLVLAAVASHSEARAQTASPGTVTTPSIDQATLTARARFTEAVPLMKQSRWQEAYPLLVEAWENKQHWQIALNLGRTEFEIGRFRDAVEHLAFAEAAADATPAGRKEAADLLGRAKLELGHVRIDASPPGAHVIVDGVFIEKAPLAVPVDVDPGPHDVEIHFGGRRQAQHVEVKRGSTVDVSLALRILDPDPHASAATAATAGAGRAQAPDALPPARTWMTVAGAGLAAIGVGVGVGTAAASFAKSSELEAKGYLPENQPIERDRVLLANISAWSFIGAGLFAGIAVASVLIPAGPAKQAMTIEARSAGTSLTLTGRW